MNHSIFWILWGIRFFNWTIPMILNLFWIPRFLSLLPSQLTFPEGLSQFQDLLGNFIPCGPGPSAKKKAHIAGDVICISISISISLSIYLSIYLSISIYIYIYNIYCMCVCCVIILSLHILGLYHILWLSLYIISQKQTAKSNTQGHG